jgi:hypothetical protein
MTANFDQRKAQQAVSASRSRREDAGTSDQDPATLSFAAKFRELKNKLDCAKHRGKFCFVNPITSDHESQDIYNLTLWAKKIVSDLSLELSLSAHFSPEVVG